MKRPGKTNSPATLALVRCAIYTRKSTEEGLEQDYNSLDAQRDAGENYVKSLVGEGWTALTERYVDDLRAPVQDVLGWASLLRRSRDEPERLEQALATIERNAELLMHLLQNLLEETRPPGIGRGAGGGAVGSSQVA